MTELVMGILTVYGPTGVLLCVWFACRGQSNARLILTSLWLALLAVLAVFGAFSWDRDYECSRLAAALLGSSAVWGSGPLLIRSATEKWHPAWAVAGSLLAPYLSLFVCVIGLLACGQMWGL